MFGRAPFGDIPFGEKPAGDTITDPAFWQQWQLPFSLPSRHRVLQAAVIAALAWSGSINDPGAMAQAETVTADRWAPSLQEPVRFKPALATSAQQFAAFVEFAPFEEAVSADRWVPPLSEPVRFSRALPTAAQEGLPGRWEPHRARLPRHLRLPPRHPSWAP